MCIACRGVAVSEQQIMYSEVDMITECYSVNILEEHLHKHTRSMIAPKYLGNII